MQNWFIYVILSLFKDGSALHTILPEQISFFKFPYIIQSGYKWVHTESYSTFHCCMARYYLNDEKQTTTTKQTTFQRYITQKEPLRILWLVTYIAKNYHLTLSKYNLNRKLIASLVYKFYYSIFLCFISSH